MDFKSLLSSLDQLSEATEKTKTGLKHTAEPGGYGRKDDEDEEGNKVKSDAPKRGRGRPKKDADSSGEVKKYDFSAFGASGKDVKLKPWDKAKTKKHSLKEYFDQLDSALNEAEQVTVQPAQQNTQVIKQGTKTLGTVNNPGLANTIKSAIGKGEISLAGDELGEDGDYSAKRAAAGKDIGKPGKNFDKIAKSSGGGDKGKRIAGAVLAKLRAKTNEAERPSADSTMGAGLGAGRSQGVLEGKKPDYIDLDNDGDKKESMKKAAQDKKKEKIDEGVMDKLKGLLVPKLMKLLGPDAEKIASAVKQATGGDLTPSKENAIKVVKALGIDKAASQGQAQMAEGIAGNWQGKLIQALYTLGLLGAGGAAASMWHTSTGSWFATVGILLLMFANTFFGEGPGQAGAMGKFGNQGTSAQRGLDDHGMPIRNTNVSENKKKKVKEGLEQNLQAARLAGKSHGLKGHSHCGKNYEDMEEARMYHEGYKEGLDECYGMGMALEDAIPATVPGMASAAEPAMDEGNAFTRVLKQTPQGEKFSIGGRTMTDRSSIEESPFAFEAWDNQLNSLLESKEQVNEGMTVSISKGQQGAPDSVSVSAQDAEADQLLSLIKSAGLGLFGGDEGQAQPGTNSPMTMDTSDPAEIGTGGVAIDVVDDHDGMMNLIKKVVGAEPKGPEGGFSGHAGEEGQDYEEEGGHEHTSEETCESCGSTDCECDHVDESDDQIGGPSDETQQEYVDQAEEEVAEEVNPNNDDEAQEEQSDATRDAALAQAADDNEKQVDEGEYANSDDDQFAADIDFMTNVISGGLNKQKSTGQTTVPVIAGQEDRMTTTESIVADWKKLAGIK